ncbi:hypothetical protein phiOC_p329 [Ochrobactrum phage vB_OspM_OC]|nr:hypothetical protein phiOC_p329 [Ochrobactrum phage vB_OspM_OC]
MFVTKEAILKRAATLGLLVDYRGFPPSDRGLVRRLQRQGYLLKTRQNRGGHRSKSSIMIATHKGRDWLKRKGIEVDNEQNN